MSIPVTKARQVPKKVPEQKCEEVKEETKEGEKKSKYQMMVEEMKKYEEIIEKMKEEMMKKEHEEQMMLMEYQQDEFLSHSAVGDDFEYYADRRYGNVTTQTHADDSLQRGQEMLTSLYVGLQNFFAPIHEDEIATAKKKSPVEKKAQLWPNFMF